MNPTHTQVKIVEYNGVFSPLYKIKIQKKFMFIKYWINTGPIFLEFIDALDFIDENLKPYTLTVKF